MADKGKEKPPEENNESVTVVNVSLPAVPPDDQNVLVRAEYEINKTLG